MPDVRPDPAPRPPPPPAPRPKVNCDQIKHTCDALVHLGYPIELAQFLYGVVGCGVYTPP